ncbi:MAG: AraC family transcriptional regulator [Clostridiales bacterium]|nr:AraC family transcriptional regulator [Clostridiales bacterium]
MRLPPVNNIPESKNRTEAVPYEKSPGHLETDRESTLEAYRREQERREAFYWRSCRILLGKAFWSLTVRNTLKSWKQMETYAKYAGVPLRRGKHYCPILVHYREKPERRGHWDAESMEFAILNVTAECLFQKTDSEKLFPIGERSGRKFLIIYEADNETDSMIADRMRFLIKVWKRYLGDFRFAVYMKGKTEAISIRETVVELVKFRKTQNYLEEGLHILREESSLGVNDMDAVEQAKHYLRLNKEKEIGRTEVANAVHLHPDYLSRIFKRATGSSLSDYLLALRMEEAKKYLLQTDLPIGEVALKVGFQDISYFTRRFKSFFGVSPREYRNMTGWKKDKTMAIG